MLSGHPDYKPLREKALIPKSPKPPQNRTTTDEPKNPKSKRLEPGTP